MNSNIQNDVFSFFPISFFKNRQAWILEKINDILEIRVRSGKPIMLRFINNDICLDETVTEQDMLRLLENFCGNSIYSMQNEINQGFITLKGGHRVGICGTVVSERNEIKNIKNVSSLNIRIAREIKGCGIELFRRIIKNKVFENTLIISPPGCGKTTILRDLVRLLSDGVFDFRGKQISLVDERSEISAVYKGVPQNDVGVRTDVMCNVPKAIGMKMMIRSMGPEILATDEIGGSMDLASIMDASNSGVKLLLTSHGNDILDVPEELLKRHLFKNIVILSNQNKPGEIKSLYKFEEDKYVLSG